MEEKEESERNFNKSRKIAGRKRMSLCEKEFEDRFISQQQNRKWL